MIDELRVRDVALIHEATLEPASGLTVLTGETGTGKTALLSSIKLLVGERADAGMVREGASALEVEGRLFSRAGDGQDVVVRRRVSSDGRGRVELDGRMASVRELAAQVGSTVDLCGQHEHQRLLDARTHVEMLDAWAGPAAGDALAAYQDALAAASEASAELERVRERSRATGEKLDEAAFVTRRMDEVDPRPGELEELEAQLPRIEHGEALASAAAGARELLSADGGALDALSEAARVLTEAARYDAALETWAQTLESGLIDIEDVASELRSYADEVDFDPDELERMQARLAQIEGLMRAYGPRMADVLARRASAREVVEAAGDGGERERAATREAALREKELAAAADALDAARAEAAPRLAAAVSEQMAALEMGGAGLEVAQKRLARGEWSRRGPSRVEFLYRPAAGLTARPLRRIASGGEISRVMLACKVVLGEADDCDTLVFDEVDAGVGGATAVALAGVLARLATTHQLIVVTHLAQVAVVADRHYLVEKSAGEVPETSLVEIDGEARVREIARMLSGDTGEASRDLAREMLAARAR
ncbi:DNA repair protein RecN [Thermophilibacter immobilis]|uniref:DNA repair protein RecN n=1 Tax=Thermophilibacter immobilis TaxID=2779519 RepID=A0A7S7RU05_9ACTN|nr:AAA family ATPase [Thermophilibacter immobilis]QOY60078.1 AAA family ATPase [Thermophilibacter immobilis]